MFSLENFHFARNVCRKKKIMKRIKLITYIVLSQWTDGGDCLPLLPPTKRSNNKTTTKQHRPTRRETSVGSHSHDVTECDGAARTFLTATRLHGNRPPLDSFGRIFRMLGRMCVSCWRSNELVKEAPAHFSASITFFWRMPSVGFLWFASFCWRRNNAANEISPQQHSFHCASDYGRNSAARVGWLSLFIIYSQWKHSASSRERHLPLKHGPFIRLNGGTEKCPSISAAAFQMAQFMEKRKRVLLLNFLRLWAPRAAPHITAIARRHRNMKTPSIGLKKWSACLYFRRKKLNRIWWMMLSIVAERMSAHLRRLVFPCRAAVRMRNIGQLLAEFDQVSSHGLTKKPKKKI